jgi:hypothetical protein
MSDVIPFPHTILDQDTTKLKCDGCRVYAAALTVHFNTRFLIFTKDLHLCRTCLHRIRPALKTALKDLPKPPKRIHPGNE